MKLLITLLVTLGISMGSHGVKYLYNGNELLAHCEAEEGSFDSALCIGYIQGFADTESLTVKADSPFCTPDGVSVGQLRAIIVKDMKEHPEKLHYPAAMLARFSLRDTFPCEK